MDFTKPVRRLSEEDLKAMNLKYYTSDIHTTAFNLPNYVRTVSGTFSSFSDGKDGKLFYFLFYTVGPCLEDKENQPFQADGQNLSATNSKFYPKISLP